MKGTGPRASSARRPVRPSSRQTAGLIGGATARPGACWRRRRASAMRRRCRRRFSRPSWQGRGPGPADESGASGSPAAVGRRCELPPSLSAAAGRRQPALYGTNKGRKATGRTRRPPEKKWVCPARARVAQNCNSFVPIVSVRNPIMISRNRRGPIFQTSITQKNS